MQGFAQIIRTVLTGMLCLALATPAFATEEQRAAVKRLIEPRAEAVLRGMSSYLAASQEFSFHAEITRDEVLPSGQKLQFGASGDLAVQRPDRLYVEIHGDTVDKRFWYDGKQVTVIDEPSGYYARYDVPGDLDGMLDFVADRLGFTPPLSDFTYSDPYVALTDKVDFGIYVGLHSVAGVRCHHLAFVERDVDWQVCVEDGTEMVPRKLVVTYKNKAGSPQYMAVFRDWEFATRLPEALFSPEVTLANGGYRKIDFLPREGSSDAR